MARRKDGFLLYAIVGAIGYVAWQMVKKPRLTATAGGGAPATNPGGTTGGAVPGSPNQVLTAEQELLTAVQHGYTAGI